MSASPASLRVSFGDEPLVLVDAADNVVGHASKEAVHRGAGILHRAFSIFVFSPDGALLLQRRAPAKPLWPRHWSNSCCSHPRQGESYQTAVHRRLEEELGFDTDLEYLYRFQYHARYRDLGAERELCSVFVGVLRRPVTVRANDGEVEAWGWVRPERLDRDLHAAPQRYTPWLRLEWPRVRRQAAAPGAGA